MTYFSFADPGGRPVIWIGSSRHDIKRLPDEVKEKFGYALYLAQVGMKYPDVEPLRGFGGATTLEVRVDHDRCTYRLIYTVAYPLAVCVLHVFQKKSKTGRKTPQGDMQLVRMRLKLAEAHYREWIEHHAP